MRRTEKITLECCRRSALALGCRRPRLVETHRAQVLATRADLSSQQRWSNHAVGAQSRRAQRSVRSRQRKTVDLINPSQK